MYKCRFPVATADTPWSETRGRMEEEVRSKDWQEFLQAQYKFVQFYVLQY